MLKQEMYSQIKEFGRKEEVYKLIATRIEWYRYKDCRVAVTIYNDNDFVKQIEIY